MLICPRYFDTIRHSMLLDKIAKRVQDPQVFASREADHQRRRKDRGSTRRPVQPTGCEYLSERVGLDL